MPLIPVSLNSSSTLPDTFFSIQVLLAGRHANWNPRYFTAELQSENPEGGDLYCWIQDNEGLGGPEQHTASAVLAGKRKTALDAAAHGKQRYRRSLDASDYRPSFAEH